MNPETLNFALRDMILNAKSGIDLMKPELKALKDDLLDSCRFVLGRATNFVSATSDANKKLELVNAIISFVEIVRNIQDSLSGT